MGVDFLLAYCLAKSKEGYHTYCGDKVELIYAKKISELKKHWNSQTFLPEESGITAEKSAENQN